METTDGLWSTILPVAKKNTTKMRGCLRHTQLLVETLHHFGFFLHPHKIMAIPTCSIKFLSFQVN